MVSPVLLQELIKDFAVCKHCSGTVLLVQKQSPRGVLSKLFLEISQNSQENTCARASFLKVCLKRLLLKRRPGSWTWTQKNLDPKKPGSWKAWTQKTLDPKKTWILKILDPEKYGINIGFKNMSDFRKLCFIETMRNVIYNLKVRVLTDI